MKRFAAVLAVFALAIVPYAFACDHAKKAEVQASNDSPAAPAEVKQVSLTGYLTDSYCGAANASAKGKGCALDCIKKGAKVQLVADGTTYTLEKASPNEKQFGVEVKVSGALNTATNTIEVATIETARKS